MHYIRFLKAPQITNPDVKNRNRHALSAKITITSDLGESFLCENLDILLIIRDKNGQNVHQSEVHWKAGFRELQIHIDYISQRGSTELPYRLSVCPADRDFTPYKLEEVLRINRRQNSRPVDGAVLEALSATFRPKVERIPPVVYRRFKLDNGTEMLIQEDTGESIARHIWDAGVMLSALLQEFIHPSPVNSPTALPGLRALLDSTSAISILELGTGCAIVSATVSHCLATARIIATDLPEAAAIASTNLGIPNPYGKNASPLEADAGLPPLTQREGVLYRNLDWSMPLPAVIAAEKFDLVVVADCTYNPDVVPYLVSTLAKLVEISPEVLICVAMKVRHESEAVFFDLMKQKGLVQVDKHVERCGNLDGDDEEIEIHLFKGAEPV